MLNTLKICLGLKNVLLKKYKGLLTHKTNKNLLVIIFFGPKKPIKSH